MSVFQEQAKQLLTEYPNLVIIERKGRTILKGIIDIESAEHDALGSFSIEIEETKGFPYRFPILYEVGGDIPPKADWHKYPNDSCCITVLPDEILKCKRGITLKGFIEKHAKGYLANHLHRVKFRKYVNGEYSHGSAGIYEFYTRLLQTGDRSLWRQLIGYAFIGKPIRQRNEVCFCGSNKKYKHCHHKIFADIQAIGFSQVNSDFKILGI